MMKRFLLRLYFNDEVRIKTWRKLSSFLRHKVTDRQALTVLRDRYAERKHPLSGLFTAVIEQFDKGHGLDEAFFGWIPQEEAMLIRGGSKSNNLASALLDCATLIDSKREIKQSVYKAMAYPILILGMLLVLLLTVSFYVVPELANMTDPASWTGSAAVLYRISAFIASPMGMIVLLLVVVFTTASMVSLPYFTGSLRVQLDNKPPWSIYRLLTGSVWLFTVATLLKANISLDVILADMLENDSMKPWLRERVSKIQVGYKEKGSFGTLLLSLGMNFPDKELVEDLAIYASLPGFQDNLYSISKEWLEDGVEKVSAQARVLNSVLLLGIVSFVCLLGLAITSMQQQLTNTMGGF